MFQRASGLAHLPQEAKKSSAVYAVVGGIVTKILSHTSQTQGGQREEKREEGRVFPQLTSQDSFCGCLESWTGSGLLYFSAKMKAGFSRFVSSVLSGATGSVFLKGHDDQDLAW